MITLYLPGSSIRDLVSLDPILVTDLQGWKPPWPESFGESIHQSRSRLEEAGDGSEIRKKPPVIYETLWKNGIFSQPQLVSLPNFSHQHHRDPKLHPEATQLAWGIAYHFRDDSQSTHLWQHLATQSYTHKWMVLHEVTCTSLSQKIFP